MAASVPRIGHHVFHLLLGRVQELRYGETPARVRFPGVDRDRRHGGREQDDRRDCMSHLRIGRCDRDRLSLRLASSVSTIRNTQMHSPP